MARPRTGSRALAIYLNDHLGGATGGVELTRRLAGSHRDPGVATQLRRLADDIAADRQALLEIMAEFGVPVRRYKVYAARLAERLGRLKPNGRLLRRSPLSALVELEMLRIGIEGKAALWRSLQVVAASDGDSTADRLDELLGRARDQAHLVETLRLQAAEVLAGPPAR